MNTLMRYDYQVLMTLICQHEISTGHMITARDLMRWARCTKPTAINILDEYVERGFLDKTQQRWRSNSVVFYYRPKQAIFAAYRRGDYRERYQNWVNSGYRL